MPGVMTNRHHAPRRAALPWLRTATLAVSCAAAAPAFAQANVAEAATEAVIVAPLSLAATAPMQFGRIAPTSAGGIVIIGSDGTSCTTKGELLRSGPCQAAGFAGTGTGKMRMRVALPQTVTLTRADGGAAMTITGLALIAAPDLISIGYSGMPHWEIQPDSAVFDFKVGGTLNVAADQPEGLYDGTFAVTIAYQ